MYAYVNPEGIVVREYATMPDGFMDVSNPGGMTEAERNAIGLYEVADTPPALAPFDSATRAVVFDAATQTVTAVYTVVTPPVEELRSALWEQVKAKRQAVIEGGVQVGEKWFHSDLFSRTQWLGLLVQGAALPAGIMWKCMDNSFVELTPTLVQQVFGAMMVKEQAAFTNGEVLRTAINAATDPRTVGVETGWPGSYQ